MNFREYWQDIDLRLEHLIENGFVKLPSLDQCNLASLARDISNEMDTLTFKELCDSHKRFIDELLINDYLAPKLLDIARNRYGFKGDLTDQYHIARLVKPGNSKEMYRAHFDSHLFTLVLPISIPAPVEKCNVGELIFFPKARKEPKSEAVNFFDKLKFKRYASKAGISKFSTTNQSELEDFNDYCPLLFLGRSTLHTNYPVSSVCKSDRLTLLSHFFDPSPRYGVGSVLRLMRNR